MINTRCYFKRRGHFIILLQRDESDCGAFIQRICDKFIMYVFASSKVVIGNDRIFNAGMSRKCEK